MRIVARLDIKGQHLIKGIHMEGLRRIGSPGEFATKYYRDGVDEIILIDAVASLYGRNGLFEFLKDASNNIYIPITVGGGIRSLADVEYALSCGADKVAVNTALISDRSLLTNVAKRYGTQCVVGSIQAKYDAKANDYFVYTECGRERTCIRVVDWVKTLESLGAGEILLTSIDQDGTQTGFDVNLVEIVDPIIRIPVIASGGCGSLEHVDQLISRVRPSAIALGSALHYQKILMSDLRDKVSEL